MNVATVSTADSERKTWLHDVTGHGKIAVESLTWLALEYLCFNMRPIDREEIVDNLPTDNPLEIASMLFHAVAKQGVGWVAFFNGRPAAVLGAFENWPGNWQIYSFGTVDYRRVLVAFLPKFTVLQQYAQAAGCHRLECRSLGAHKEAHGFLRAMGFVHEATLHQYGRKRQDYLQFRRILGD